MSYSFRRLITCFFIAGCSVVHWACGSEDSTPATRTLEPPQAATEPAAPITGEAEPAAETPEPEATKIPTLRPEEYSLSVDATEKGNAVELQIETNIPGMISLMASISLKGQAPDDVYIGTSQRVGIIGGSTLVVIDTSELPAGVYEAEVGFYPRWGFQDDESRSTGITRDLKASQEIRLGGSGESASDARFREESQRWVAANIGSGDPWNEGEWTRRFGSYETWPVEGLNPDVIKVYYFPTIDMTIFVNALKSNVSHWRFGRASR